MPRTYRRKNKYVIGARPEVTEERFEAMVALVLDHATSKKVSEYTGLSGPTVSNYYDAIHAKIEDLYTEISDTDVNTNRRYSELLHDRFWTIIDHIANRFPVNALQIHYVGRGFIDSFCETRSSIFENITRSAFEKLHKSNTGSIVDSDKGREALRQLRGNKLSLFISLFRAALKRKNKHKKEKISGLMFAPWVVGIVLQLSLNTIRSAAAFMFTRRYFLSLEGLIALCAREQNGLTYGRFKGIVVTALYNEHDVHQTTNKTNRVRILEYIEKNPVQFS